MANRKISELNPAAAPAANDLFVLVEVASGETKKATLQQIADASYDLAGGDPTSLPASAGVTGPDLVAVYSDSDAELQSATIDQLKEAINPDITTLPASSGVSSNDLIGLYDQSSGNDQRATIEQIAAAVAQINGGATIYIPMAIDEDTDSSSYNALGSFALDASDFDAIEFITIAATTSSLLTGSVQLWNVTDSSEAAVHTITGTSPSETSTLLTLPTGKKLYEVRYLVSGGTTTSDRIYLQWAGLKAASATGSGLPVDGNVVTLNTSGTSAGNACYVSGNSTVSNSIATSAEAAKSIGFVHTVGGSGTGRVQISGLVQNVNFIPGLTLSPGDSVFISKTAGKVTNSTSGFDSGDYVSEVGVVADCSTYNGTSLLKANIILMRSYIYPA